MNMPANQTQSHSMPATKAPQQAMRAFTFWVADTLYAIDISKVLTISQDVSQIQSLPAKVKGLVGMIEFQDNAVPVIDFANMLGLPSGIDSSSELIHLLEQKEQDHVDWLDALEDSLLNDHPFTKAKDPNKCAFGRWYNSFKSRDETLMEVLGEFDAPHKHIHSLADKLLDLKATGEGEKAIEILMRERNITLKRLRKRFEQAREHLAESARAVLLYVTMDGITPTVALRIDDINDVVDFKTEQFKPMQQISTILTGEAAKLIVGYLKQKNEADCLLVDASLLLEIAKS